MDNLENLSRKELQALAKSNGVKANLSNADIIAKLIEIRGAQVSVPEPEKMEEILDVPAVIEAPAIVEESIVEIKEVKAAEEPVGTDSNCEAPKQKELEVGDNIEANIDGAWVSAIIKRLNKKTVRVRAVEDNVEYTVQFDEVRTVSVTPAVNEAQPMEVVSEESVVAAVESAPIVEEASAPVMEPAVVEEAPAPAVETVAEVPEMQMEEEAPVTEVTAEEPVAAEPVVEVTAVAPASPKAAVASSSVPPTPLSLAATSVGWNSCTKFSLQDSAVKSAGVKRRERRNARRSAMKELADSMRQEIESAGESEAEAESPAKDAIVAEPIEVAAPEVVQEAPTPAVLAPVSAPAPTPVPTPAATTVAAPASAQAGKDGLPRMNKAQAMRVDAIHKKIVTTEIAPVPNVAFTSAAKAPVPTQSAKPTVAHTPSHYRNSICTSAPSTANLLAPLSQPRKLATPTVSSSSNAFSTQQSRLSMQVSGTKRKVTDSMERDRSSSANAPDFKRLHSKQFTALKSIAECVDQDKKIGVRMTIAMESAMSHSAAPAPAPTPAVAPFKPLHSAHSVKPVANPFSMVINKSTANTPSKLKSAGATPVVASRPMASGSGNIIKSRTVTSFVPSSANSCGGKGTISKVTSFVNNENAGPSSTNVTSFLKSKDSGSASFHKHRSVVISNGGPVNHGATKQRLQMF